MAFLNPRYGQQLVTPPKPGASPLGASLDWGGIYNDQDPAQQGPLAELRKVPNQMTQISPFGNTLLQRGKVRPRNWQQSQQALFAALGER